MEVSGQVSAAASEAALAEALEVASAADQEQTDMVWAEATSKACKEHRARSDLPAIHIDYQRYKAEEMAACLVLEVA
jgi:hypothetical protein